MTNNTRFITDQYDKVYEYDTVVDAYIFIGKLNGSTLDEFIDQYYNDLYEEHDAQQLQRERE